MRIAVGIAAVLAAAAGIVAVAANGCTPPLPEEGYCELDKLVAVANVAPACQECLYKNTQCCDAYGACQEAGAGCPEQAASELRCVVDAGPLGRDREPLCLKSASAPSMAVYGCVKDNCAEACGIGAAACVPDPVIPSILAPKCDGCATTNCCTSLNACYQSRPCKIAFECFLGCAPAFIALFQRTDAGAALQASVDAVCHGAEAGFVEAIGASVPCIDLCLKNFILPQVEAGIDAASSAGCASLSAFSCTYSNCREDCATAPDVGVADAGDAAAPATDTSDAGDAD